MIDFPDSPTPGQEFTVGGLTWVFNDPLWNLKSSGSGGGGGGPDTLGFTFTQDTAPTTTRIGDTWFDTATGRSFVWFDSRWVQFSPGGGGGGASGPGAPVVLAKSTGVVSFTTTSIIAERVPELALTVTPTHVGQKFLIEANLFVGASASCDDSFFTIIERNAMAEVDKSVGASGVNAMASHRWLSNANGLELANVRMSGIYTAVADSNGKPAVAVFEPAMWVRVNNPVQQLYLNRRGQDAAIGCVSSISATDLSPISGGGGGSTAAPAPEVRSWSVAYSGGSKAFAHKEAIVPTLTVPTKAGHRYLLTATAECLESTYGGGRNVGIQVAQMVGGGAWATVYTASFGQVQDVKIPNTVVINKVWEASADGDVGFALWAYNSAGGAVWVTGGGASHPEFTVIDLGVTA